MGQKMSPIANRLGFIKDWLSRWYSEGDEYVKQLHEDLAIRKYVSERMKIAGIDSIEIVRSLNKIDVNVYVARPGVAIGRGGEGIDLIKKELTRRLQSPVNVKINEVKKPELSARVIAQNVAEGMQRGQAPKRLMIAEKDKALQAGAKGVRIWVSGDFGIAKQSRTMKLSEGTLPLQTLRSDIDFATVSVGIRNEGLRGVKVWVCRDSDSEEENNNKNKRNKRRNK